MNFLFAGYVVSSLVCFRKYEKKLKKDAYLDLLTVSHEVKNPLSVCKGYIEIMNKRNNYDIKFIDKINNQLDDALNIVNDYLDLGKDKVNLDYMDFDLLVLEVYDNFKNLLDEGVNISFNDREDDEIIIKGDYVKLKEVLNNVIKNCIESKILGEELNIELSIKKNRKKVILDVSDDGVGIKGSKIGKSISTSKKEGNGIGMFFSRRVIELHKGEIEYIKKKRGTVVRITLPLSNIR